MITLRQWFKFSAQADDPTVAELLIYDEIGQSFWNDQAVTAKQCIAELAALPEAVTTLKVRVNSPGGDPFDAVAIANALRAQSKDKGRMVLVSVEGLAASAATIITCAGDNIAMADNALMMIHQPSGFVMGPAVDMRQTADALDRISAAIIATYQWVSKLSAEALGALMDAETWLTAEEAVANGFATEIISGVKAAACFRPESLARLGTIPDGYRNQVEALVARPEPAPEPIAAPDAKDLIKACREAGFPELAEDLLGHTTADVTAKLEEAKAARAIREAQTAEIRALCATAKFPDLAEGYIRGGMALAEVKSQLTALTAKRDAGVINPSPPGAEPAAAVPVLRPIDVYRARQAAAVKGV